MKPEKTLLFKGFLLILLCLLVNPASARGFTPSDSIVKSLENWGQEEEFQCELEPKEAALATLIIQDNGQKRSELICNPMLVGLARGWAQELSRQNRLTHLDGERRGPNERLLAGGYPLAVSYPRAMANQVEALVGGYGDPEEVWEALKSSDNHRQLLLGETEFFVEQNEFGVGHYRDVSTSYIDFWVIYIARQSKEGEQERICTVPPHVCF